MRLYLVRHGEAEEVAREGGDAGRRLTPEGRRELGEGVAGLSRLGTELTQILTSPLARARQTAQILHTDLRGPEPEVWGLLAPGADLDGVLAQLDASQEAVALVGHEPCLGRLVSLAVTGREADGTPLRKGGVACIDFQGTPRPGAGRLVWLLTPKLLRRIGRGG